MSIIDITSKWRRMKLTSDDDDSADLSKVQLPQKELNFDTCLVGKVMLEKLINIESFKSVMKKD